eukprot:scaffold7029_cov375-Pinguiococcus_pyrenoidosus.AAC.17
MSKSTPLLLSLPSSPSDGAHAAHISFASIARRCFAARTPPLARASKRQTGTAGADSPPVHREEANSRSGSASSACEP